MKGSMLTRPPSSSVGDYVKALWEVSEAGVASTKDISERLSVSPASVTNMLKRLQKKGLVEYEPYHGASLTEAGCVEALRLVRRHRLIETFLTEKLGYPWEAVHEEAERLEHAVSDRFTERLADLLANPEFDPHGSPIPTVAGTIAQDDSRPLAESEARQRVRISRVSTEDASTLTYMWERGLVPGKALDVNEVRAVDGVVTVEDEDGGLHSLGGPLAASIFVRSTS